MERAPRNIFFLLVLFLATFATAYVLQNLSTTSEKISACAFSVSLATLYNTLNERRSTLRSAMYGKRLEVMEENGRLLARFYRAVMLLCTYAEAAGAETEEVKLIKQKLDQASDEHAEYLGSRALYFENCLISITKQFLEEIANFYRAYNLWAKEPTSVEALHQHKRRLEALHTEYFNAARRVLGLEELTADAKRIIGMQEQ